MQIFLQLVLLILGFVMLVKGADWLVEGASGIAEKAGISKLVIGLTIVAMGTSAPEAAISISASIKGSAAIAVGNVLGSNILNILLILGLTAVITPLAVHESTVKYEIPFVFFVTIIFALIGLRDKTIGRIDGVILWVMFIAYLCYLFYMSKNSKSKKSRRAAEKKQSADPGESAAAQDGKEPAKASDPNADRPRPVWQLIALFLIGLVLIIFGSNMSVDAATELARIFGISERIIGLTIVAFGTSLPELVTSVTAARKKEADIAVGNIVGSNIFNILFVIGTAAILTPVAYELKFTFDSVVAVLSVALLWICVVFHKRRTLQRWGGVVMLAAYALYFGYLM